jgi:hypothetical protein
MEIVANDFNAYPSPYYTFIFHKASFHTDILAATADHLLQGTYR